jgi:hypothetical protein
MTIGFAAPADDGKSKNKASRKKSESKKEVKSLDLRRRKYLKARLDGRTKKAAALLAGFSEEMAANAAAKIETPLFRSIFAAKAAHLIPEEKLILRLAEGLDAVETKVTSFEGKITDFVDCIDFDQRRKYLELALSVTRRVESHTMQKGGPTVVVPIQIVTSIPRPERG